MVRIRSVSSKKVSCSLTSFILVLLLTTITHAASSGPMYTVSYSPGTTFHALVRDRVKVIYERAGIPVEFVALPHKRSLYSADTGVVDAEAGRIPRVESVYENLIRVDCKVMDLAGAAYVLGSSDFKEYSEDQLGSLRVGVVHGVQWCQKKVNEWGLKKVTPVKDYQTLFDMLKVNRVDIVLATTGSAESVFRTFDGKYDDVERLSPLIFRAPIYHYVNKRNVEIIPALEKALQTLIDEDYWGDRGSSQ